MMASFCDMLLPLVAHRLVPAIARRFLPTISLQIDYLAPAPLGAWVQGEADVLRVTRTLVFAHGVARIDGTPVLRVSGAFKIGQPFNRPVEGAGD
jgi:acyl-coenzyme A thioesterase PaaI-like protein